MRSVGLDSRSSIAVGNELRAATSSVALRRQLERLELPVAAVVDLVDATGEGSCRAGGQNVQLWLEPIELARSHGLSARELNVIRRLIETHHTAILEAWHEHCG